MILFLVAAQFFIAILVRSLDETFTNLEALRRASERSTTLRGPGFRAGRRPGAVALDMLRYCALYRGYGTFLPKLIRGLQRVVEHPACLGPLGYRLRIPREPTNFGIPVVMMDDSYGEEDHDEVLRTLKDRWMVPKASLERALARLGWREVEAAVVVARLAAEFGVFVEDGAVLGGRRWQAGSLGEGTRNGMPGSESTATPQKS